MEHNLFQIMSGCQVFPLNFDTYLDARTVEELDRTAKKLGETRGGVIRKALREWLDEKTNGSLCWPSPILEWQGVPDAPAFESYRDELLPCGEASRS